MSRSALVLAAVLAVLAPACRKELPPFEDRVRHLDLRLEDGRSPADVLAAAESPWVEELVIEGPQTDLGGWSALHCRVDPVPPAVPDTLANAGAGTNGTDATPTTPTTPVTSVDGGSAGSPDAGSTAKPGLPGGIALTGIVPDGLRMKRVEFRSSRTYEASEVDFLEIEIARTTPGIARVSWRSSLDLAGTLPFPRSATAVVPGGTGPTIVRIPLSSQPGWVGEISELAFAPKEGGVQRFDLLAVRLGRIGFTPGPDVAESDAPQARPGHGPDSAPGDEQDRRPGAAGRDGGLISLGREARRAYPSDWNVPLFARTRVPRGGLLAVEAAVSPNTINLTAEVRFVVDARGDATEPWQRVAATSIVPGMSARGPTWEHVSASLERFAGKEVELRFLAAAEAEPALGGKLDRARLFWGEPLVLPELGPERRPNVVLITLDTVRADAIGAYASARSASPTPFLDSLAARGLLFEDAWSACNATSPSHASLMTGLAVQDHGLLDNRSLLAPENVTLAERFRAAGWQTAAAVSVPHLAPDRSGLGQGFDRVWSGGAQAAEDGARTVAAVREWWRGFARERSRPTFLWLHLFDAHTPYAVPEAFLVEYARRLGVTPPPRTSSPSTMPATAFTEPGGFLEGVTNVEWPEFEYRAAVAYQDQLLRGLFAELDSEWGPEQAFVAVIADHGEALGEHGNWYHHTGLYREVMRVPLIVAPPRFGRAVRVAEPVWSLDLARTLFGVAGVELPAGLRGIDLLDFAADTERPRRRLFFEHSDLAQVGLCDEQHTAIYTELEYRQLGRDRIVPADTLQVFDARADPEQKAALEKLPPELDAGLRALFRGWREGALRREHLADELDEEEARQLKLLGY